MLSQSLRLIRARLLINVLCTHAYTHTHTCTHTHTHTHTHAHTHTHTHAYTILPGYFFFSHTQITRVSNCEAK